MADIKVCDGIGQFQLKEGAEPKVDLSFEEVYAGTVPGGVWKSLALDTSSWAEHNPDALVPPDVPMDEENSFRIELAGTSDSMPIVIDQVGRCHLEQNEVT